MNGVSRKIQEFVVYVEMIMIVLDYARTMREKSTMKKYAQ